MLQFKMQLCTQWGSNPRCLLEADYESAAFDHSAIDAYLFTI